MKRCEAVECGVNKSGGCRLDKNPRSCLYRPQMEQLGELKKETMKLIESRKRGHVYAFFLGGSAGLVIGIAFGYFLGMIL